MSYVTVGAPAPPRRGDPVENKDKETPPVSSRAPVSEARRAAGKKKAADDKAQRELDAKETAANAERIGLFMTVFKIGLAGAAGYGGWRWWKKRKKRSAA